MKKALIVLLFIGMPQWALAQTDIVKIPSHYDVSSTMDRFEQAVEEKGMAVFARIDHQENARRAGLSMNPAQVLIFGNPRLGTSILLKDPAAALDLPLRVSVYEDAKGKVWLSYHNPRGLESSYDLAGFEALNKASATMEKFSVEATK